MYLIFKKPLVYRSILLLTISGALYGFLILLPQYIRDSRSDAQNLPVRVSFAAGEVQSLRSQISLIDYSSASASINVATLVDRLGHTRDDISQLQGDLEGIPPEKREKLHAKLSDVSIALSDVLERYEKLNKILLYDLSSDLGAVNIFDKSLSGKIGATVEGSESTIDSYSRSSIKLETDEHLKDAQTQLGVVTACLDELDKQVVSNQLANIPPTRARCAEDYLALKGHIASIVFRPLSALDLQAVQEIAAEL